MSEADDLNNKDQQSANGNDGVAGNDGIDNSQSNGQASAQDEVVGDQDQFVSRISLSELRDVFETSKSDEYLNRIIEFYQKELDFHLGDSGYEEDRLKLIQLYYTAFSLARLRDRVKSIRAGSKWVTYEKTAPYYWENVLIYDDQNILKSKGIGIKEVKGRIWAYTPPD